MIKNCILLMFSCYSVAWGMAIPPHLNIHFINRLEWGELSIPQEFTFPSSNVILGVSVVGYLSGRFQWLKSRSADEIGARGPSRSSALRSLPHFLKHFQIWLDPLTIALSVLLPHVVQTLAESYASVFYVLLFAFCVFVWSVHKKSPLFLNPIWLVFSLLTVPVSSVRCHHCFDQLAGCMGGETCGFVESPTANALLTAGAAAATAATSYKIAQLLPMPYLAVLTRTVLDSLLALAKRPSPGVVVNLEGKALKDLLQFAKDGTASAVDVLDELATLIPGATEEEQRAIELSIKYIEARKDKGSDASARGETVGALRYVWALTGKIVSRTTLTASVTLEREGGSSTITRLSEKITRPKSMEQFSDMISTFTAICHVLGLCNLLLLTFLQREVVYDTMLRDGHPWQFAHELLLVYLEDIDLHPELNFSSVLKDGSVDRRHRTADVAMCQHYGLPSIFRSISTGSNSTVKTKDGVAWNGRSSEKATKACADFNLGKECTNLFANGTCRFKHCCDAWVTNKGKDGICGSTKHVRGTCDNPDKGARQTQ